MKKHITKSDLWKKVFILADSSRKIRAHGDVAMGMAAGSSGQEQEAEGSHFTTSTKQRG